MIRVRDERERRRRKKSQSRPVGIAENDVRELFALFCIVLCTLNTPRRALAEASERASERCVCRIARTKCECVVDMCAAPLTHERRREKEAGEQETGSSAQRDDVLNYYCPATEYKTFKFISSLIARPAEKA
jgi:hypothetical protein